MFLKRGFDGLISCAAFLQQFQRWIYCEFNFKKKYLYFVNPEDEPLWTDRRATVPSIVKTVYLLRTKSCARFGLNFSIFLLCQVKIPDER